MKSLKHTSELCSNYQPTLPGQRARGRKGKQHQTQRAAAPVSSRTGTLSWETTKGVAVQEPGMLLCSRGPQQGLLGSNPGSSLEATVATDMGTCLPHSRAHPRGGAALYCCQGWCQDPRFGTSWGNYVLLPCKSSSLPRGEGRLATAASSTRAHQGLSHPTSFQATTKSVSSCIDTGVSQQHTSCHG